MSSISNSVRPASYMRFGSAKETVERVAIAHRLGGLEEALNNGFSGFIDARTQEFTASVNSAPDILLATKGLNEIAGRYLDMAKTLPGRSPEASARTALERLKVLGRIQEAFIKRGKELGLAD